MEIIRKCSFQTGGGLTEEEDEEEAEAETEVEEEAKEESLAVPATQ